MHAYRVGNGLSVAHAERVTVGMLRFPRYVTTHVMPANGPGLAGPMTGFGGHQVTTNLRDCATAGLLDRPVKPRDDKEKR